MHWEIFNKNIAKILFLQTHVKEFWILRYLDIYAWDIYIQLALFTRVSFTIETSNYVKYDVVSRFT